MIQDIINKKKEPSPGHHGRERFLIRGSRADIELSDLRIWYLKFAGKMTIAFGVVVILMSFQHL